MFSYVKSTLYYAWGPNFIWHVDGFWDKLKPFRHGIYGAIGGYSHRMKWLEVGATKNGPNSIANYYLKIIKDVKCDRRIIRADCCTENMYLSFLQPFLCLSNQDSMAGIKSVMNGKKYCKSENCSLVELLQTSR